MLRDCRRERLDKLPLLERKALEAMSLLDHFEAHVNELEAKNIEIADHYKQICQHEEELANCGQKNPQNLLELAEYKESVSIQIDPTLPPFFLPTQKGG
mmetsp:Transcript_15283/g.25854  ORF Transcript_15283/g.25854 Transcript_15283/m.25854 type:complete len:99 (+) Transcript_15283:1053-1349(+)